MSVYRAYFRRAPLNIMVTVEADNPRAAKDFAWYSAQEYLSHVLGDRYGVVAECDLEGISADVVTLEFP